MTWIALCKRQLLAIVASCVALLPFSDCLAENLTFQNGRHTLEAHYLLPKTDIHRGVVIFVHGDGPINYDADGYYPFIWNRLRAQGYAIFSWSKPGLGGSSGNWLDQSLLDRQKEVHAAIDFLRKRYFYTGSQIGLLGFSQAGWIVPAVARNNAEVGFVIGIGFAIDWLEQGWYMNKVRLVSEGENDKGIEREYQTHLKGIDFLKQRPDYKTYLRRHESTDDVMSERRYGFVLRNMNANAYKDYVGIKQPMLILLGEDDLNVDVNDTREQLRGLFQSQRNIQISMIDGASHGMLDSRHFNQQSPTFSSWLKLIWMGERAFAKGFFPVLEGWIESLRLKEAKGVLP